MRRSLIALLLLFVAACPGRGPGPKTAPQAEKEAAPAEPESGEVDRVERLVEELEEARRRHHIPGMAVAVVKEGRVVLARGFGVADRESKEPVTEETLFAVGSTTKAFTAALAGMLVDDGIIAWDDPIERYLPRLRLQVKSGGEGEEATFRDALCHRTGFPRMGILFASGELSRDEILAHAAKAKPTEPLGETFLYNNVVYTAAGAAAARAANASWEEVMRKRLLEPLGMNGALVSAASAAEDPRMATGYTWYEDRGEHERESVRIIDAVAPAGALSATAEDMARWVQFQLAGGVVDGERLLSEASIAETRRAHIDAGPFAYALGWFRKTWRGELFLEHGGNIDGFAASVGFLPESQVGYALLTNLSATPLQAEIGPLVFDTLLREPEPEGASDEDFTPYLGEYIADFGPFDDERFEVLVQSGRLAVDVPGQQVYELRPPGEDGRRAFVMTDTISVSFDRNDEGDVIALRLHQAGYDFELPRVGAELPVEVAAERAEPYLGIYEAEEGDKKVTVKVHRGRLAVDVPGQMVYDLHLPDEEGRWRLRVKREAFVSFERSGDGPAERLVFHREGEEDSFVRSEEEAAALPTVEELLRLRESERRKRALARLGTAGLEGKVRFPQAGVEGRMTLYFAGTDRYREELDLGDVGRSVEVTAGDHGWVAGDFDDTETLEGIRLRQAQLGHPGALLGDFRDFWDSVQVVGTEEVRDRRAYAVRLKAGELPPATVLVDAKTGDVLQLEATRVEAIARVPVTTTFSEYRRVHGVRVPHRTVVENPQAGTMVFELERLRKKLPADPKRFAKEPPAE